MGEVAQRGSRSPIEKGAGKASSEKTGCIRGLMSWPESQNIDTYAAKPNRSTFFQNCSYRPSVIAKLRSCKMSWQPSILQRIPEQHIRSFTKTLQPASTTPDPIGKFLDTFSAYDMRS
jgi:hypothetical protein